MDADTKLCVSYLVGGRDADWAMEFMLDFSYLIDRQHRFLLVGIVLLVMSAFFTLSGETLERYGHIVSRAEKPKQFWWSLITWFLLGLFFIGLHLYQNSN